MAVAFGSSDKHTPTSDEFRTRSGKSCVPGVHSDSGGLFIQDVANTAATYGVHVAYGGVRRTHAQLVSWCKANGSVVLGDYDQLPLSLRVQDRFTGDHSVWVHDFRDDTFCWHDPLDTKPQRVRSAIVSRYNQKVGSPTKGLQGWTVVLMTPPDTGTEEAVHSIPGVDGPFPATVDAATPVYDSEKATVPRQTLNAPAQPFTVVGESEDGKRWAIYGRTTTKTKLGWVAKERVNR